MPTYLTPGVYVEEVAGGPRPIAAVGTSTPGFVGAAPFADARVNEAVAISNWSQFVRVFVGEATASTPLSHAVFGFFLNGGSRCYVVNVGATGDVVPSGKARTGLAVLDTVDEVAIVAAPGATDPAAYDALLGHCEALGDRVAILDPPENVPDLDALTVGAAPLPAAGAPGAKGGDEPPARAGLRPRSSSYGAFYFPRIVVRDPLTQKLVTVPPSGHVAGLWSRSDATRGVHKAPANEPLRGALDVAYRLSTDEQGVLNEAGVNAIRATTREGIVVWGARTLAEPGSETRYLNVRRLLNMVEESIAESTRWVVFEPNDQVLWQSITRDVTAFLTRLWRDGGLRGRTPEEAFFVRCNDETNPPDSIDAGIVVTVVGLAPVKPAEFVVFRISQRATDAAAETKEPVRG